MLRRGGCEVELSHSGEGGRDAVKYTADLPFCGNKSQVQPTAATMVEVLEAHA